MAKNKKAMSKAPEPVAVEDLFDDEPEVPIRDAMYDVFANHVKAKVPIPDAFDDGPKVSPYTSPTCSVCFQDGKPFMVPRDILCVSDKLKGTSNGFNKFFIKDVPAEAGHVLLHYLHTRTWQTLCKRSSTQFETSVYVYAAAHTYDLAGLAELAKENIPRYANELSALDIIVLAGKPCERLPDDDPWFLAFINKQIEQLFADPASLDQSVFLECLNGAAKYSRILAKSVVSICCQKSASAESAEGQAVPVVDEAPSTDSLHPTPDSASEPEPNETDTAFEALHPRFRVTPCGVTIPWVPSEDQEVEAEREKMPRSLLDMYERRKRFRWSCIAAAMQEADGGRPALDRSSTATHVENSKWEHCSKCSTNVDDSSIRYGSSAATTSSSVSESWRWPYSGRSQRYT